MAANEVSPARMRIPVILITLFTAPEDGTANDMTGVGFPPLTVEEVSLLPGVRQAFGDRERLPFLQALALQFDPMRAVNDAIKDRVSKA
jgi:hypothetical protein